MNVEVETLQFTRARPGLWLTKGWDWFMEDPARYLLLGLVAAVLLGVSYFLIWGPVLVGLAAVALRRIRLGRLEIADFFEGFRYFVPAFLSGLLVIAFSVLGLAFLLVPGIVIFAMYLFTFHFIFDQGQDFWEAMESSRKLVSRDYFGFSVFALLILAINLLGIAFLLVGSVLTVAVTSLAITTAYLDCIEAPPIPTPESKPLTIE